MYCQNLEIVKHIGLNDVVYYTVFYLENGKRAGQVLCTNNGFKLIEFITQELQRPPK